MFKSNFSLKKYKNLFILSYLLLISYIKNKIKNKLKRGKFKTFLLIYLILNNLNKILLLYKSLVRGFIKPVNRFIGIINLKPLKIDL